MHTNGYTGPLDFGLENADTVPDHGYLSYRQIEKGKVYCTYTQDGFFALVHIVDLNPVSGKVEAQTLFQPVRNLRLFKK